jgi:hypothetical protein
LQKSLLGSTAARGRMPHEEDEQAVAGNGEARTRAASAHAGIVGGRGWRSSARGGQRGGAVGEQQQAGIPSAVWAPEIFLATVLDWQTHHIRLL